MNIKIARVRKMAENIGIVPGTMNKKDLIQSIQMKEGNFPCFKTDQSFCGDYDCRWRIDCHPSKLIEMPQVAGFAGEPVTCTTNHSM